MCGITGFIDFNKRCGKDVLEKMTNTLSHRGPDAAGYQFFHTDGYSIGLGHRRLSIIDLSSNGNQPFIFGDWQIIFNGEIYNYKEIKVELENCGRAFKTNSDTEVLINAIDIWGEAAFTKLIGMFAFAVYNQKLNTFYLVRDRAGVKPLYYYLHNGLFLFSSELKAFHANPFFEKKINTSSIAEYMQLGYIQTPNCIFENASKLNSGSFLKYNLSNSSFCLTKYWDIGTFYQKEKLNISEHEAIDETEKKLVTALNYRMVSDVPVGMFLSGGIDSSIVTAMLQKNSSSKLNTITIGFNEAKFNEAIYAKKIAEYLGTNHTEYYCTQKDALEIVPDLPGIYDEPFGDSSAIPTTLVSRLAAKSVKVVLSADGGDELFAGYGDYVSMVERHYKFKKVPTPVKQAALAFKNVGNSNWINKRVPVKNFETVRNKFFELLQSKNIYETSLSLSHVFTEKELNKLILLKNLDFNFKPSPSIFKDDLSNLLAKDFNSYLIDDILVKVDRATMSCSIEGREPLLDHQLIEFVTQLPSSLKIKNGEKKYLLKKVLNKYLPTELTERPKMGFSIPVVKWLNDELKAIVFDYLSEDKIRKQGIFDVEYVKQIMDGFYNRNNINERKIWYLFVFQLWYEKWIGF